MKSSRGIALLILGFVMGGLFQACQKDQLDTGTGASAVLLAKDENPGLHREALEEIEGFLQAIVTTGEFRNLVDSMVELQFDEDWDVLLRDLCSVHYQDVDVQSAMDSVELRLRMFEDIDDRTYYPQLHIPYYDKLRDEDILGTANPVMVVFLEDLSEEPDGDSTLVTGRQKAGGGDLVVVTGISGFYAQEHEVWVLSLNERVDDEGNLRVPETKLNSCEEGEIAGSDPDPIIGVVINKITIKEHKESWLAGGSEIHILGFRTYWDGDYPNGGNPAYNVGLAFSGPTHEGPQILWVSRSDVDDETEFTVDFPIVNNWDVHDFYQNAILIGYTIFEFDSWPAGVKARTVEFLDPPGFQNIYYKSSNHAYTSGRWLGKTLSGTYSPAVYNYSENDTRIAYNLCWEHQ